MRSNDEVIRMARRQMKMSWLYISAAVLSVAICAETGFGEMQSAGHITWLAVLAWGVAAFMALLVFWLCVLLLWTRQLLKEVKAAEEEEQLALDLLQDEIEREFEIQWQKHIQKHDNIQGIRSADRPQ